MDTSTKLKEGSRVATLRGGGQRWWHLGDVLQEAMTGVYVDEIPRESTIVGHWQQFREAPQMRTLWQLSYVGALTGQISGVSLCMSSDGGPLARARWKKHWWRRSENQSGPGRKPPTPLSLGPRPRAPSLTGAGVSAGRKPRRRRRRRSSGETRGPDRKCCPPSPAAPRRLPVYPPARPPGSGSRARLRGAGVEERGGGGGGSGGGGGGDSGGGDSEKSAPACWIGDAGGESLDHFR